MRNLINTNQNLIQLKQIKKQYLKQVKNTAKTRRKNDLYYLCSRYIIVIIIIIIYFYFFLLLLYNLFVSSTIFRFLRKSMFNID